MTFKDTTFPIRGDSAEAYEAAEYAATAFWRKLIRSGISKYDVSMGTGGGERPTKFIVHQRVYEPGDWVYDKKGKLVQSKPNPLPVGRSRSCEIRKLPGGKYQVRL